MYREVHACDNRYQRDESRTPPSPFLYSSPPSFHLCLSSTVATIKVHSRTFPLFGHVR